MFMIVGLFVIGWVAVALLGSLTYFMGEQSKPIHERNWRSTSFEQMAASLTGTAIDYSTRVPAFVVADAYTSSTLPDA